MKTIFRIICLVLFIQLNAHAQSNFKFGKNVKKVLFIGNSITYSGEFVAFVETNIKINFPNIQLEFLNLGLPSETVSGLSEPNHANGRFPRPDLHERLERTLKQIKPDVVFACYGMNDGIYLPYDDFRFQKFKDGIQWIREKVSKSGAELIHMTPPIYDGDKGISYTKVLAIYSDWLINQGKANDWEVIDLHWPMQQRLDSERKKDASFVLSIDGVHPNKEGHWVMAKQILLYIYGNKEINHISTFKNGENIFNLIKERQNILRDSWLSLIGHHRPGLNEGIPLKEAERKSDAINSKISSLLNE